MNKKDFKELQAESMRKVASIGRKRFLAKFKSKKKLSDYMKSLAEKRWKKK